MRVCERCRRERKNWDSPCVCPAGTPERWVTSDECSVCGGDGVDGSHEAALFYAYSGEITNCDACSGTGVATPQETSDR